VKRKGLKKGELRRNPEGKPDVAAFRVNTSSWTASKGSSYRRGRKRSCCKGGQRGTNVADKSVGKTVLG